MAETTSTGTTGATTETVTLQVTRYRPDQDAEPTVEEFDVPLRKDWSVLDGLNHIKDRRDGSLSYRWSCRMGICGSCGMTVNGEPRLTCATFLVDYAPGPIRVEPLANFPVIRDLVVDIGDFMRKLPQVNPWIVRGEERPVDEGEYLQTPAQLEDYSQFSMCINCMLCYSACPVYGLDPEFIGPAAIALAQRYNLDSRDEGAEVRHGPAHPPRRHLGVHLRRRVHPGLPQGRGPGRRDPAVQADRGDAVGEVLRAAPGGAMTTRDDAASPATGESGIPRRATGPAPVSILWWLRRRTYVFFVLRELSCLAVAWAVVLLLLLVRAVAQGGAEYGQFLDWAGTPWVVVLNVVTLAFLVLHAVTWFNLTPAAMVVRVRGPAAAPGGNRRRSRMPAGSSCRRWWPGW